MVALDKAAPTPLYYQLKQDLLSQIQAGHYEPHTMIPSEPELCAKYHVSRATVRQALSELGNEGWIYRQHGKGTFVADPKTRFQLQGLDSLSKEIKRRGETPGGRLVSCELVRGPEYIREILDLAEEEQMVRLARVRTADDVEIASEVAYLPYPRATQIYKYASDIAQKSLYSAMASEGLHPHTVKEQFRAGTASQEELALLDLLEYAGAGIRVNCTTFDPQGKPVAYSETFFSCRFVIEIKAQVSF